MTDETPPRRSVSDRYRITERIGSGGFGTVWRATDEDGGPDVAVKFPRSDGNGSNDAADVRSMFRNEHAVLERFEGGLHPTSLVRYVDGSSRDPMYIVLEHVEGTELSELLAAGEFEPGTETARRFGVPAIRALEFLHRNGVCYLDCKPENMLVRERTDAPVLVDFNTAEPVDSATTLFYEDDYKAPEQTPDDDPDGESDVAPGPRSDVYAAGKLLCYLLTGETMTTSATPRDGIDVRDHGADPPAAVRRAIERATSADPANRPADASELLTELYDAYGEETAVAELTDRRNDVVCPVRPGETIGRVTDDGTLPDVAIADQERYASPVHCRVERDETSWLVRDHSLNGTYLAVDDGWQRLLSPDGYERLKREAPDAAPPDEPYHAGRIRRSTEIALVDPSYVRVAFDPAPERRGRGPT